jgi:pilus assembly protein CpaB
VENAEPVQKRYNIYAIIFASVIGLVSLVFLIHLKSTEQKQEVKTVLIASKDISKGEIISEDMITEGKIAIEYITTSNIDPSDLYSIIDSRTTVAVKKGQPILHTYIEGERILTELSARIPVKERAITISVNQVTGIAGHLAPNDLIDIIGTFDYVGEANEHVIRTKTLLQAVTVLAVGEKTGTSLDLWSVPTSSASKNIVRNYSTVTLKVTPEQAELIVFAEKRGDLRLVLRGSKDYEVMQNLPEVDFSTLFLIQKQKITKETQPPERILYER